VSGVFRVGEGAYEDFMGRYSRRLAPLFAEFAGVGSGDRVLDVGAGTGALVDTLLERGCEVVAAEPSPEFCDALRRRLPDLEVHEAPAEQLQFANGTFDAAVAQLVLAFMADAPAAVAEMARVARRVAVCMWGVEEVDMFAAIGRTASVVGPSRLGEPRRYRTAQEIRDLLAPLGEVESAELDVTAAYRDFDDFWQALSGGSGPAGQWLASLDSAAREHAHEELFRQFGSPDGPFELNARAFAAAVTSA
jgi:SAM-dependent methyltransferase